MRHLILAALLLGSAAAQAAEPKVSIVLKDHQWVPSEVPIPAGVKVQLVIRNEQATAAEFESPSLHREKVVSPGREVSVYVGPLSPGRYEFFDDFNTSSRGALVVK